MKNKEIDTSKLKAGLESFDKLQILEESFFDVEGISAKKSFDGADQNNNYSQTNDEEKPKYIIAPDHN